MKPKYDISIEISEAELRKLIQLHAKQIGGLSTETAQYLQPLADRMSVLLDILRQQKRDD